MDELIRLKVGMDSVKEKELIDIIKSYDKDYLTRILFLYFRSELNLNNTKPLSNINNNIVSEMQTFNEKIVHILRLREEKANKEENSVCSEESETGAQESLKLDDLPSIMISSISSFLEYEDVLNFERCNERIFIGTRSPISLYSLSSKYSNKLMTHLNKNMHHNQLYWNRFNSIKQIELEIGDCYQSQYALQNIPIWNDIKSLIISDKKNADPNRFANTLSVLPLDNINTIKLDPYLEDDLTLNHGSSLEFLNLLANYNNIVLPQTLRGYAIQSPIYQFDTNIPSNVESIHLPYYQPLYDDELKFNSLKEICMYDPTQKEMDFFNQQNLDHLKRINCCVDHRTDWDYVDDKLKRSLKSVFSRSTVDYLSIKANQSMDIMLDILMNGLMEIPRESVKIRLSNSRSNVFNAKRTFKGILKMINILQRKSMDFMIIATFDIQANDGMCFESMEDQFGIKTKIEKKENEKEKAFKFVLSNKGCKINGYQEKWLMNCARCEQHCF